MEEACGRCAGRTARHLLLLHRERGELRECAHAETGGAV
jgi:hypothetical protein